MEGSDVPPAANDNVAPEAQGNDTASASIEVAASDQAAIAAGQAASDQAATAQVAAENTGAAGVDGQNLAPVVRESGATPEVGGTAASTTEAAIIAVEGPVPERDGGVVRAPANDISPKGSLSPDASHLAGLSQQRSDDKYGLDDWRTQTLTAPRMVWCQGDSGFVVFDDPWPAREAMHGRTPS